MFVEILAGLILAGATPCAADEMAQIRRQLATAKNRQPLDSLKMAYLIEVEISDIWPVFAKTSVSDKVSFRKFVFLLNPSDRFVNCDLTVLKGFITVA